MRKEEQAANVNREDMQPWLGSWPKEVRKSISYPTIPLSDLLSLSAQKHPRKVALVYFDAKITYRALELL